MNIKTLFSTFLLMGVLLTLPLAPSYAVCSNNEDGVPGVSGEIEYFTATNELMYCDDTDWVLMTDPTIPADSSTDVNFFVQFFQNALNAFRAALANQFFAQNNTINNGDGSGGPTNCSTIGDVCTDGSVYTGLSPDGNIQMYATPADQGVMPWNNGNGSGTYADVTDTNCSTNGPGSTNTTCLQGAANTANIITIDADTSTAGTQPHQAAQACADLVAHGHSDWYLPAMEELWVLYNNRTAIGGFANDYYWSSSEDQTYNVRRINFANGASSTTNKNFSESVRCVRKELTLPAPVGYWRLDETTGTTAVDNSTNSNDGTMSGGLNAGNDSVGGVDNTALNFDGTADYINIPSAYNLAEFTTCSWLYLRNSASRSVFISKFESAANGWWVEYNSGFLQVKDDIGAPGPDDTLYATAINEEEWVHFCAGIDSSLQNFLYVNGSLVGNSDGATGAWDSISSSNIFIGQRGDSTFWVDGAMDDIRVYDSTLTADEITAIYSQGKIPPIGHWKLDETTGTTATDSSVNGNDGTHTDASPAWSTSPAVIDGALEFTPSSDNIDIGNWNVAGTGSLTLSAWVYKNVNDTEDRRIISKSSGVTDPAHTWALLNDAGTNLQFRLTTENGSETNDTSIGATALLNKWSHVSVTYDATTGGIVYYLDGTQIDTDTHSLGGNVASNANNIAIGNNPTGAGASSNRSWSGYLDDVRVYNRPLSAAEVLELYNDANDALVGHWKLDETSGTTAVDSSTNGNDGTMTGGINGTSDSVTGTVNTALNFDGASDRISAGNIGLLGGETEATLCAWIKPDASDITRDHAIISEEDNEADGILLFIDDNAFVSGNTNTFTFFTKNNTLSSRVEGTSGAVELNQWQHICGTFSGSNYMYLYKNGALIASNTTSISPSIGSPEIYPFRIGERTFSGSSTRFQGSIDDVRIYDQALTAAEILELYNKPNEALVGHWKLDETSGTTAADSSINGNDATLTGADFATDSIAAVYDAGLSVISGSPSITAQSTDFPSGANPPFTYAAWVNYADAGGLDRIFTFGGNGGTEVFMRKSGDAVRFWGGSAYVAASGANVNMTAFDYSSSFNNQWLHIAAVYDGTDVLIYRNGVYVDSFFSASFTIADNPFLDIADSWRGGTDDARFYNRVLSAAEILELYNNANLPLVGHWKLDETSGTVVTDSSSYGNDGSVSNAASATTEGIIDNAFEDVNVSIPHDNTLNSKQITVSAWVIPNMSNTINRFITKDSSYQFELTTTSRRLTLKQAGATGTSNVQLPSPLEEKWYHLAASFDDTTDEVRYYLNGELYGTATDSNSTLNLSNTQNIRLGDNVSTRRPSKLDDVRIYNTILSDAEVLELYENSLGGLVAHYRLDETSGTTAADSTPSGNDGTMQNGLDAANDRVDGPMATAINFDGTDDYISTGGLSLTTNTLTLTAWVNLNDVTANDPIFYNRNNSLAVNSSGLQISNAGSGVLGYNWNDDSNAWNWDSGLTVPTNEWVFTAVVVNPTEATVFLGTQSGGLTSATNTLAHNSILLDAWSVGYGGLAGRYTDGSIDDARMYNRALSATEILALYNAGYPPTGATDLNNGLVGYWPLDETSGTTAADSSGFNNPGTPVNGFTIAGGNTTGKISGAFDFAGGGTEESLSLGDTLEFRITGPITVAGWFKPDVNQNEYLITKLNGANRAYDLSTDAGTVGPTPEFRIGQSGSCTTIVSSGLSSLELPLGKWSHVAGVYDPSNHLRVYINGVITAENTTGIPSASCGDSGQDLTVGCRPDSCTDGFDGGVDDVRIYNRALTPSEIEVLAGCTGPGSYYYNFSDDVMQWCDGVASPYNMGPKDALPGTQCTGAIPEAAMGYAASAASMFYCDGLSQIPIGRSCTSCGGSATEKIAFITHHKTNANFGGIAGADAQCQLEADNHGLSGTYLAWIADSNATSEPAQRFSAAIRSGTYSIVRPNGETIANDWTDLTDGTLDLAISTTASGRPVITNLTRTITNVDTDGTQSSATDTCSNFTSSSGIVIKGNITEINADWTNNGTSSCTAYSHILCFEQ